MDKRTHQMEVLLFDDVNILDVAGPVQTFSSASELAHPAYRVRFVSIDGKPVKASCGLALMVDGTACVSGAADDLIVPGGCGVDAALQNCAIIDLISDWRQGRKDRRIISICSGALLLAKAGQLDGMSATTHWSRRRQALEMFDDVEWDTDRLYFDLGPVMTSAGVTSGIDLALAIVRRDCGPSVALAVARELVVYLQRSGGQHQFADLLEAQYASDRQLRYLMERLVETPGGSWTLERMAETAGLTSRTLTRRFSQCYALSPVKFLERLRVKMASDALSAGAPVVQTIALAGFGDYQQMQRAFKRQLGTTIGEYRNRFSNTSHELQ